LYETCNRGKVIRVRDHQMSIAVLFPGQGSIAPSAGTPWLDHPAWAVVERVEAVAGRPLASLLTDAPAEALARTDAAQLATLTLSLVAWEAVRDALEGEGIVAFAGHSLGQITALIASGAVAFDEGVALATDRADATRSADDTRPGRLAALLGADLDQAAAACAAAPGEAWVANDNAPGQVVIGGTPDGLAAAVEAARELGVRKAMPLAVGGAFHTPLQAAAAESLRPVLERTLFTTPSAPVVDNTEAEPRTEPGVWPELLTRHLVEPVRWREVQRVLVERLGVTRIVELTPAGTLTAMAKRTIPEVEIVTVESLLEVRVP
jgi:[acyl-carrier-protein] S-malonyltransferase